MSVDNGMSSSEEKEFKNPYESRCSFTIEMNSRGFNTKTHVYGGCTKEEIDDAVYKAVYGHNGLIDEMKNAKRLTD